MSTQGRTKTLLLIVVASALAGAATTLLLVKLPLGSGAGSNPPSVPSGKNDAPSKPYELSDCEARGHSFGEWKAQTDEVLAAAVTLSASLCYGYWEFDPRRLAATFMQCSEQAHSPTVSFQVVEPNGGCTLTFRTASWQQRRWIWVQSAYAWGGQFGDQIDILEVRAARSVPYATRWQCSAARADAIAATTPPSESPETQISPELRGDWSTFPPELRGFLCEGKLTAENVNDP